MGQVLRFTALEQAIRHTEAAGGSGTIQLEVATRGTVDPDRLRAAVADAFTDLFVDQLRSST